MAAALMTIGCSTELAGRGDAPAVTQAPTIGAAEDEEDGADPWASFETGPSPQIPYLDRDRYVDPRGPDIEIKLEHDHPVAGVVPIGDRWLVTSGAYFEGSTRLLWVDPGRGSQQMHSCISGTPVASSSGGRVAWLTHACPETGLRYPPAALHVADADSGRIEHFPVAADGYEFARAIGFVGDAVVYQAGTGPARLLRPNGTSRPLGATHVSDVHRRLLAVSVRDRRDALIDLRGNRRWTTTHSLQSFSPDGSQLLAFDSRRPVVLSVADGSVVTEFELPRWLSTYETVWETDDSLLVVDTLARRTHIVRLRLDGTVELAAPARQWRRNHPGYVVPEYG